MPPFVCTGGVGELFRVGKTDAESAEVAEGAEKGKSKSGVRKVYIPPFAKCMRRMGHPSVLGGVGENGQGKTTQILRHPPQLQKTARQGPPVAKDDNFRAVGCLVGGGVGWGGGLVGGGVVGWAKA